MASGHVKAEHMAAPTNAALVKKALANSEPSTHGPKPKGRDVHDFGRYRVDSGHKSDIAKVQRMTRSVISHTIATSSA
jgi:hypothetical protein